MAGVVFLRHKNTTPCTLYDKIALFSLLNLPYRSDLKCATCVFPGSSNIMSMSHRRPSGAKLHSLAVEAPMTKVINIILAAQENSPLYIAQALDKVCFGGCALLSV